MKSHIAMMDIAAYHVARKNSCKSTASIVTIHNNRCPIDAATALGLFSIISSLGAPKNLHAPQKDALLACVAALTSSAVPPNGATIIVLPETEFERAVTVKVDCNFNCTPADVFYLMKRSQLTKRWANI